MMTDKCVKRSEGLSRQERHAQAKAARDEQRRRNGSATRTASPEATSPKDGMGQESFGQENGSKEAPPKCPTNVPPTPELRDFGTSQQALENEASPETQAAQELAESDAEEFLAHMYHWDYLPGTGLKSPPQTPQKLQPNKSRTPLSDDEKDRVAMLMAHGYSLRQAAACLRRTHVTLSRHLKKDQAFADKVERFRRHAESDAIDEIVKASRKSWRAAAWLLQYLERREQAHRQKTPTTSENA